MSTRVYKLNIRLLVSSSNVCVTLPIEVDDFGGLLTDDPGVVEPELVGVSDFATGVGGLSF